MVVPPQSARNRSLRFSLRFLLFVTTMCCLAMWCAMWWWQRPYDVESTLKIRKVVEEKLQYANGRQVDSFRRQLGDDPVKHGPTRHYDDEGNLIFEEFWSNGVRHGLYRKWDPSGSLIAELEFDGGRLIRCGETDVEDFFADLTVGASQSGAQIHRQLQKDTKFDYMDTPLNAVVDEIALRHSIPILLDHRAFDHAGIQPDMLVQCDLQYIPLFAAMSALLSPHDLTCVYRFELLWITTLDHMEIRKDPLTSLQANGIQIENREAKFAYRDQPLDEVLQDLSSRYGLSLRNEVSREVRVTLFLNGLSLPSSLRTMLYLHGLRAEVVDGDIVIRDDLP